MAAETVPTQSKENRNITREQLNKSIVEMVANTMIDQARGLAVKAAALHMTIIFFRACYIAALIIYMLSRQHFMGAFLVAIICITYDNMQVALNKKDYYTLAAFSAEMLMASIVYLYMGGKAIHLCMVVFGIFLFRYVQLWVPEIADDAEDVLTARGILLKEGIGDKEKVIVTTRRHKQYVYEWDEKEIIEFLEGGGELPDAAPAGTPDD